ncbi:MAG: saccharopine dehydrogenase family protein [Acidimicrobiales bacterium]
MSARIVLWGATGYTGRLVTEALVRIGERPLLAGRDASRLAQLSDSHGGLDTAVADVERSESIRRLLEDGDVLVSTVGPFTLYGKTALEAAVAAGAHYIDSTGEPAFMRDVFSVSGPIAERRGTTLLTAFGYDYVPGNVAGASAVDRAGTSARHLQVAYLLPETARHVGAKGRREPVISTGTRASLLAIGAAPHHVRRQGRLALEPSARKMTAFIVDGRARWASSIGGSEPLALPRTYPELDDVAVFMEFPGQAQVTRSIALGFSVAAGALGRTAQGRRAIRGVVKAAARRTGGGPSAEARARSGTLVVATCRGEEGRMLSAVRLEGPTNGYTLTGHMIAWGASSLRAGAQKAAGAVGPVEAFGLEQCGAELSRAGLALSEMKELKE